MLDTEEQTIVDAQKRKRLLRKRLKRPTTIRMTAKTKTPNNHKE